MSFYPPKISERFRAPRRAGKAEGANALGTNATFVCGAALRFTLRIEPETGQILEAKFQTNGCGYLTAAADVLAEKLNGKHLAELHGLDHRILQNEIENELGRFGARRRHCLELSVETIQSALADFRASRLEEWTGEKALICTCFGVSEETVEKVIRDYSLANVEEVTRKCSAGGGCGSCQPLIREILDDVWRDW